MNLITVGPCRKRSRPGKLVCPICKPHVKKKSRSYVIRSVIKQPKFNAQLSTSSAKMNAWSAKLKSNLTVYKEFACKKMKTLPA